jgi:hypothetical protein
MNDLQQRWKVLEMELLERFEKVPDLNAILLLIGIQEVKNTKKEYTKEEKQDAMHVAVCTLLSQSGYYELEGYDVDGWPHFKQMKDLPNNNLIEQENFLKDHVLVYFQQHEVEKEEGEN